MYFVLFHSTMEERLVRMVEPKLINQSINQTINHLPLNPVAPVLSCIVEVRSFSWLKRYLSVLKGYTASITSRLYSLQPKRVLLPYLSRGSHICLPCRSACYGDQNVWLAKFHLKLDRLIYLKILCWSLDSETTADWFFDLHL